MTAPVCGCVESPACSTCGYCSTCCDGTQSLGYKQTPKPEPHVFAAAPAEIPDRHVSRRRWLLRQDFIGERRKYAEKHGGICPDCGKTMTVIKRGKTFSAGRLWTCYGCVPIHERVGPNAKQAKDYPYATNQKGNAT